MSEAESVLRSTSGGVDRLHDQETREIPEQARVGAEADRQRLARAEARAEVERFRSPGDRRRRSARSQLRRQAVETEVLDRAILAPTRFCALASPMPMRPRLVDDYAVEVVNGRPAA